jgi:hypothetical protein
MALKQMEDLYNERNASRRITEEEQDRRHDQLKHLAGLVLKLNYTDMQRLAGMIVAGTIPATKSDFADKLITVSHEILGYDRQF